MKKFPLRLSASLLIIASMMTASVSAQEELRTAATEAVHLQVGDIFEILPATDIANATYTWILTQDRTFLEATRAPIFRKRLIQPGRYTLFAEISSPDGSRRITRNFTLYYSARQPGQSNTVEQVTNGELVHTTPATDTNGRVAMPAGTQLLLITPVNPDIRPLNLDTDLSRDSNGDGNLENDLEGEQTFFGSDATPLYLWITDEPLTKHSLSITAAGAEGGKVQKIDVLDELSARNEGMVQGPLQISSEEKGERTYRFSAVFDGPAPAGSQLLYQWQFGDNQQSLVTTPEHTFAEDGVYTVSLLIRNLRDGKDIANASTVVNVASSGETGGTPSSQASSDPQEQPDGEDPATPRNWSSILMLGGLFVGSILLGILAIVVLGFLRKKKTTIADTFEKVEQTLVKSPMEAPTLTIAPPAATVVTSTTPVKRETPPASIATREEEIKTESQAAKPTPSVDTKEAPAWLKNGLSGDTTPSKQATGPEPTPVPSPVATRPTVTPQPKQTPAWLQQPTTPATPKPAPVPPPVKQPAAVPTPTQTDTPVVTPAAVQQKQPTVPAWQSQPAKQAEQPLATPAKPTVPTQSQNRPVMPEQPRPAVPAQVQNRPAMPPQQKPTTPAVNTPTPAPRQPITVPTPVQTPKPVTSPVVPPTPIVPPATQPTVVPVVTPAAQMPVNPQVPAAATPPVVQPVVKPPMPAVPTPITTPAQTPKPVTPVVPVSTTPVQPITATPVPVPVPTPVQPVVTTPVQQNKPPVPVVPPQAPRPIVPSTVQTPEMPEKPAPIDIPKVESRPSDEPIAFIRAESLNPQDQQNG